MKNQRNQVFKRVLAVILGVFCLMAVEEKAEAQYRTGVNVNWVPQPGYAYFSPYQQQLLLAMKNRQNALSNYGTAVNLQAARLYAYQNQIKSFRRAQFSQMQSWQHYQNAIIIQQQQVYQKYYQQQNQFNRKAGWQR